MPRHLPIDLLRAVSIYGVVLIHSLNFLVNGKSGYYKPFFELSGFWRFCVPFFFIIAGYFAYKFNPLSPLKFLQKIILKLILPFIAASTLSHYLFWGNWNWEIYFQMLINGGSEYGHWFIPLIILTYLIYYLSTFLKKFLLPFWVLITISSLLITFFPITGSEFLSLISQKWPQYSETFRFLDIYLFSFSTGLAQIQFYIVYFGFGIILFNFAYLVPKNKSLFSLYFAINLIFSLIFGYLFYQDFLNSSWLQRFAYFNGYLGLFSIFFYQTLLSLFTTLVKIPILKAILNIISLAGKYSLWILLFHGLAIKALTVSLFPFGINANYRAYTIGLSLLVITLFIITFFIAEMIFKKNHPKSS